MGKLTLLREHMWWFPRPHKTVLAATAYPRVKPLVVGGGAVITGWAVSVAGWLGAQSIGSKIALAIACGLLGAGVVGFIWHWIEGRFVSDAAKHRRLAELYHNTAVPALCHVKEYWEYMQNVDPNKFGPLLAECNGIVLLPVIEWQGKLEAALNNQASPPSAIIGHFRWVFQYHWRALLWIHANMGFVGLRPDEERYKAMMAAHRTFADRMRLLSIQPGFRKLGKIRRTLNRERELIVTPWTVRYD